VKLAKKWLALIALASLGSFCATPDRRHQVIISIPERRMVLLEKGTPVATYPVSIQSPLPSLASAIFPVAARRR
jgi:hypothetical protein